MVVGRTMMTKQDQFIRILLGIALSSEIRTFPLGIGKAALNAVL